MLVELFQAQYDLSDRALRLNLEGISEEESLWLPSGGGNCINWILGQLLASRQHVLSYLDEDPVWDPTLIQRHSRGTESITSIPGATLSDMLWLLDRSHDRILERLRAMSIATLGARVEGFSRVQHLMRLYFQESYYVGQIGLLREMLGKGDVDHIAELPSRSSKQSSVATLVFATPREKSS